MLVLGLLRIDALAKLEEVMGTEQEAGTKNEALKEPSTTEEGEEEEGINHADDSDGEEEPFEDVDLP